MSATLTERSMLRIAGAAAEVGVSPSWLRQLEAARRIPPPLRTIDGQRLYSPEMVETIKAAIRERRQPLDAA